MMYDTVGIADVWAPERPKAAQRFVIQVPQARFTVEPQKPPILRAKRSTEPGFIIRLAFNPGWTAYTSSGRFCIEPHIHTLPYDLGDNMRREKEMV